MGYIQNKLSDYINSKEHVGKHLAYLSIIVYYGLFILVFTGIGMYWKHVKGVAAQPIGFSHKMHVKKVGLQCNYCHKYAEKGKSPGIPTLQKCMSCHENAVTDRLEVQKLARYWKRKEPVPWKRIHSLPQHVYFTHKRHVRKGINCVACHGEIQVMDVVEKVKSLEMGWCVRCHRLWNAPTDCLTCHK